MNPVKYFGIYCGELKKQKSPYFRQFFTLKSYDENFFVFTESGTFFCHENPYDLVAERRVPRREALTFPTVVPMVGVEPT